MSGLLVSRSRPACPSWRGSQRSAFRRGIVPVRDIYLKIETISGYSPVEPDDHVSPPIQYRRDCMRNMGHEDGTIPPDEGAAPRLAALSLPEYLCPPHPLPTPPTP